jgi:hypothetical protein
MVGWIRLKRKKTNVSNLTCFIDVLHLVTIELRENIESFLDSFGNGARLGRQCHHKQVRILKAKLFRLLLKVFKVVAHEKVSYRANKHS